MIIGNLHHRTIVPCGIFSAYPSAIQGGGFLLAVNNMQSAVCEDVLAYDLDYDAVVRVDNDGQPIRDFVDAIDLDDAQKRKTFCQSKGDKALNVGFVFNKISPDDDGSNQPKCNEACSVAALAECVLTKTETCTGTNSNRKYYDLDHCACLCLDTLNMDSDCNCQNNLVWDESTKKCVQCLDNSHCSGNTPVCNGDTNTCEACPTSTPVWNYVDKKCEACPTGTPNWNGSVCVECLTNTDCTDSMEPLCDACTCVACPNGEVWDGTNGVCVECLTNTDCTDSSRPLCDAGTCVACPTSTPVWNGSSCETCPETYIWQNGECVSCLIDLIGTSGTIYGTIPALTECNNTCPAGKYADVSGNGTNNLTVKCQPIKEYSINERSDAQLLDDYNYIINYSGYAGSLNATEKQLFGTNPTTSEIRAKLHELLDDYYLPLNGGHWWGAQSWCQAKGGKLITREQYTANNRALVFATGFVSRAISGMGSGYMFRFWADGVRFGTNWADGRSTTWQSGGWDSTPNWTAFICEK